MHILNGFPNYAIDKDRNSIIATTLEKYKVELGELFQAFHKTTIPAGQTLYLAYKTPLDKEIRAYPTIISTLGDSLTFKYSENAQITGGTISTAYNQNRQSDKTSGMILTANPTVVNPGTQIAQVFLGGGQGVGQTRSGANSGGGDNYWLLKPNTVYLFTFENGSTLSNTVQINEIWLEK